MNPQVSALLNQMINMMPQFQQALAGILRTLPAVVQSVGQLVATLGRTAIGQAAAGLARSAAASGLGQFAGAAAGAAGQVGGAVVAGIGALAASPIGQVVLAATAAALALTALGVVVEKTGRAFLESQRHLADSSAAMAMVFAQSDIRRVMREMKAGGDQATTAGFLARSLDSLADTLQPILSLLTNIANLVLGAIAQIVDLLVAPISAMAQGIMDIFAWLRRRWPFGGDTGDPKTLSQWLDDMSTQARQERNLPWVPRGRFVPAGP